MILCLLFVVLHESIHILGRRIHSRESMFRLLFTKNCGQHCFIEAPPARSAKRQCVIQGSHLKLGSRYHLYLQRIKPTDKKSIKIHGEHNHIGASICSKRHGNIPSRWLFTLKT
ncbi:unnamed protein product [Haemonchus placei]|uniref:Secreted protein n=1 Tax=Haemonchus placei TaxID=6290 RepID=A0A3P7U2W8_HAEPC|nr:unnamed protein product [Haemonchus placei]